MADTVSARRSSRLAKKDVHRPALQRRRGERDLPPPEQPERRSKRLAATKPYDRPDSPPLGSSVTLSTTRIPGKRLARRPLRIPPSELDRREQALIDAERELQKQKDDLARHVKAHEKKQQETDILLSEMAERDTQSTLAYLEEHFTCPLCFEVASAPYSVNSPNCGHTFCAICILKWFFSRLHPPCGSWHESVDCPICRARLILTPDVTPRSEFTFPFVPNRLATTVITAFIEKIAANGTPSVNTAMKVKREEEEVLVSGSKRVTGRKCSRKAKGKEAEVKPRTPEIDVWREGGAARTEWQRKEKEGKQEMTRLHKSWRHMQSNEFLLWKVKLGV